jgi:AraC family transcriptional regulator, arabinose operon regulatory protein
MIPPAPDGPAGLDWEALHLRMGRNYGRGPWPKGHAHTLNWRGWPMRDYDLWFFYQGNGKMRTVEGQVIDVRAGTCFLMRPGDRFEFWQDEEGPQLGNAYFHFDLFDPNGKPVDRDQLNDIPLVFETFDVKYVDLVTQRILALLRASPERSRSKTAVLQAELLLKCLLMEFETGGRTQLKQLEQGIELRHQRAVSKILDKIYDDPSQPGGIEGLARASGYSLDYFSRIFKSITGTSPNAALIEARLEKAKAYLTTSDLSLEQISDSVGYRNVFYFSRQFRQKTGMPPSEYRKKFHQNKR